MSKQQVETRTKHAQMCIRQILFPCYALALPAEHSSSLLCRQCIHGRLRFSTVQQLLLRCNHCPMRSNSRMSKTFSAPTTQPMYVQYIPYSRHAPALSAKHSSSPPCNISFYEAIVSTRRSNCMHGTLTFTAVHDLYIWIIHRPRPLEKSNVNRTESSEFIHGMLDVQIAFNHRQSSSQGLPWRLDRIYPARAWHRHGRPMQDYGQTKTNKESRRTCNITPAISNAAFEFQASINL